MMPQFPHVVEITDEPWGQTPQGHPVAWCDHHVPINEWEFYVSVDPDQPDADELYVFSFKDQNWATQFALLYG